jgi:FHA domain
VQVKGSRHAALEGVRVDPFLVRWESLAFLAGVLILAGWALIDATRTPGVTSKQPQQLLLEIMCPGERSRVTAFTDGTLIGRGPECQIILHDATVSKNHAVLRIDGSRVLVEDLQSTNGTLVNGRVIDGPTAIEPGDRIGLGPNVIWFLGGAPSQPN